MGQSVGRRLSWLAYRMFMQSESSILENIWISIVVVSITFSRIIQMKLHSQRVILGHKWCNYWFHVQHLNDKSGKMSKSKGDFLTVSLLEEKGYNPLVYQILLPYSHIIVSRLSIQYEVMDNVKTAYEKILKRVAELSDEGQVDKNKFDEYKKKFLGALENDLNTSMAITVVYDMLKDDLNDKTKLALIKSFDEVLSLNLTALRGVENNTVDNDMKQYIEEMIQKRASAKKEKDFAKADAIREELLSKGIVLKDTREGTVWTIAD